MIHFQTSKSSFAEYYLGKIIAKPDKKQKQNKKIMIQRQKTEKSKFLFFLECLLVFFRNYLTGAQTG